MSKQPRLGMAIVLTGLEDEADWPYDWRQVLGGFIQRACEERGYVVGTTSLLVANMRGATIQCHVMLTENQDGDQLDAFVDDLAKRGTALLNANVRLRRLRAYDEFLKVQKELEEANSAATTALAAAQKVEGGVKSTADLFESVEKLVAAGGKILTLARMIGAL